MKIAVTLVALLVLTACDGDQYVHEEFLIKAKELCAANGGIKTLVLEGSIPRGYRDAGSRGWARCHNTAQFKFSVEVEDTRRDDAGN